MDGTIFSARVDRIEYLKFVGIVRYSHCSGLENHINKLFELKNFNEIVIDLTEADILDSTALGLLARVSIEFKKHSDFQPVIFVQQGELANILKRVCFDQVFTILFNNKKSQEFEYIQLESRTDSEKNMLKRVISAHRSLAELDKKNIQLFRDITQAI